MPIFERDGQKVHFVHIPKTGGKSLTAMFEHSGWSNPYKDHGNKLSVKPGKLYHDHMPHSWWKDWEEASRCDFEFAVSRNPITRMTSLVQMWLRSFWLESHGAAYRKGGSQGLPMRELFVEMGILNAAASDEDFRMTVGAVTYPPRLQDRQSIAEANSISLEEYEYFMKKNIEGMIDLCAEFNVEKLWGRDLHDTSWVQLVEMFMNTAWFENIERTSATPLPCHKYVSDRTHVYKLEDYAEMLDDLVSRGFLDASTTAIKINAWSNVVSFDKLSSWSDSEVTKTKFYELYDRDFEIFGYDKNTPFPGQKHLTI